VLFVLSLPRSFTEERTSLNERLLAFGTAKGVIWPEFESAWEPDAIRQHIEYQSPHVLHIFGICRGSGPDMRIALDHATPGEVRWATSAEFVKDLQQAVRDCMPQLVVLHLCKAKDVDYAATFGSVAPQLLAVGFPAVLAMQYPLPVKEPIAAFPDTFYSLLASGTELGTAVQEARNSLGRFGEHLRGAPVLYLQTNDGVLIGGDTGIGRGGGTDVGVSPTEANPIKVLNAAITNLTDPAMTDKLQRFVDEMLEMDSADIVKQTRTSAVTADTNKDRKAWLKLLEALDEAGIR
jgi:hypothetical protein